MDNVGPGTGAKIIDITALLEAKQKRLLITRRNKDDTASNDVHRTNGDWIKADIADLMFDEPLDDSPLGV